MWDFFNIDVLDKFVKFDKMFFFLFLILHKFLVGIIICKNTRHWKKLEPYWIVLKDFDFNIGNS